MSEYVPTPEERRMIEAGLAELDSGERVDVGEWIRELQSGDHFPDVGNMVSRL